MKYKEIKQKKTKKEVNDLLLDLKSKINNSFLEKSEDKKIISLRKNLKKDIAKVLTFKNTMEFEKLNDK